MSTESSRRAKLIICFAIVYLVWGSTYLVASIGVHALPPLLFDLKNDPYEMTNLAGDPNHRDVLLTYAQRMLSWRMRHADRTLVNLHLSEKGVTDGRQRSKSLRGVA